MSPGFVRALVALSLVPVAFVGFGGTAQAAQTCGAASSSFTGGYSAFSSAIFGTRSRIEYNNPDLCGSDADGPGISVVWSMVTAPSDSSPTNNDRVGWAQTGYGQFGGASAYTTGIWNFAQWTRKCKNVGTCGSDLEDIVHTVYLDHPSGAQMYANVLRASDDFIHMYVDGVELTKTTYNPAGDWDAAWQGQFFAETHEKSSDVVGTSTDVTSMDYLQKYDSAGGVAFFSTINGSTTSGTRYHRSAYSPTVGGNGLKIWTDPLS
ncbi:MAG: hypothetical protein JWP10_664 [Nocardioidaceae bacterium]|nr:hypothetical protein [Nocardioidaceae bacterium]